MDTTTTKDVRDRCKVYVLMVFSNFFKNSGKAAYSKLNSLGVSKMSNAAAINVLKRSNEPNAYIVAFNVGELMDDQMVIDVLFSNIIYIFDTNLPADTKVDFTIGTIPMIGCVEDSLADLSIQDRHDMLEEMGYVLSLHNEFVSVLIHATNYDYATSDTVTNIASILMGLDDSAEQEEEEDGEADEADVVNSLNDYVMHFLEDSEPTKKKKKKGKKTYRISRAVKAANSPKKSYKRHGVIICSDKDAIKKDRKIIKEFLKDFIPGDSKWKRHFRDDLLDRWIRVYVITKKQLKRFEKNQHRESDKDRLSRNARQTIDFTRRLFNVPIDTWNDPTR